MLESFEQLAVFYSIFNISTHMFLSFQETHTSLASTETQCS